MKQFFETQFTTITVDGQEQRVPDLGGLETDSNVQYSVADKNDGSCLTRVTAPQTEMTSIENATATTAKTDQEADTILMAHFPRATLENLDQPDVEVQEMLNQHSVDDVLDAEEKRQVRIVQNLRRDLDRTELIDLFAKHGVNNRQELVTVIDDATAQDIINDYSVSPIPSHLDTATVARSVVQVPTYGGQVLQDQEVTALNKVAKAKGLQDAGQLPKNTRVSNSGDPGAKGLAMLSGKNTEHQEMLEYVKGNRTPPWANDTNPPGAGRNQNAP